MIIGRFTWLLFAIALTSIPALLDDYRSLVAISFICALVFLFLIYDLLVRKQGYRFFLIASLSCGAWASLGVVQSGIASAGSGGIRFSDLFGSASSVAINVSDYSIALAFLFVFILFCDVFSRLSWLVRIEKRIATTLLFPLRSQSSFWSSILLITLSILLLAVSFLNLYSVRGLSADLGVQEGTLPWWYTAIQFTLSLWPILIAINLVSLRSVFLARPVALLLGLPAGAYFSSLKGRSALIAYVASIAYSWILIKNPSLEINRKSLFRIFIIVVIALTLLPIIQSVFIFINVIREDRGLYTNPILLFSAFVSFVNSPLEVADATVKTTENLVSRPLILWPLAASIKMDSLGLNNGFILFQDIVNSFLNSLPRFIFPDKDQLLLAEDLLYRFFPFSGVDTADSPYLFAFTSFWFIGAIIYPFLIFLVYSTFLRFVLALTRESSWFLIAVFTISPLTTFAIYSYTEFATTGLFRTFISPLIAVSVWSVVSFFITKRKSRLVRSYSTLEP